MQKGQVTQLAEKRTHAELAESVEKLQTAKTWINVTKDHVTEAITDSELARVKNVVMDVYREMQGLLTYISHEETRRAQARAQRLKVVRTLIALKSVDEDMAKTYQAKHQITDQEINEAQTSTTSARTRTANTNGGHVITDGTTTYRNRRSAFEACRSFAKSQGTGHVTDDRFEYRQFLADVVGVDTLTNGTTWQYGGKTWKYEYVAG